MPRENRNTNELVVSLSYYEVDHESTPAGRDMKMEAYLRILVGPPFPLMGKGRDRGAREPIKLITPTFVLPRQGEGIVTFVSEMSGSALVAGSASLQTYGCGKQ